MSALVVAESVTKRYFDGREKRMAVDDVSLAIEEGAFAAVAGPSGSGKTTLLAILGGLITPTRGDVKIAGTSLVHLREHHRTQFRREQIGFVFQELQLIPRMSLLENVLLPLVPLGRAREKERALALLKQVGLEDRAKTDVRRLSGGEKQRGAIARAMITEPKLLLLDEPSAHLDEEATRALLSRLTRLGAEGTTLIVSSHDPRVLDDACVTQRIDMRDGKLLDPLPDQP